VSTTQPLIFRKGLDMKEAVAGDLAAAYHSRLVDEVRGGNYRHESGRLTVHLAREFGFCYGVDRAVDYAYQAVARFPGRNVFLTGEIIHNPHVNDRLRANGIRFLSDPAERGRDLGADDVVILPAFGITVGEMEELSRRGCTLVDTTCGSVLNVWKNVVRYAQEGFTAIIHGKMKHEETRATASQARRGGAGHYLIVLDQDEAGVVCGYIRHGGDRDAFLRTFENAVSPDFDPDVHLQRIGCANQTTMLSSESLQVGQMFRAAVADRYGEAELAHRFRAFDTICSATQDRQDAVIALLAEHELDLMIVLGGHNSSNTYNLARICAQSVPTYHVADPASLLSDDAIEHRPAGGTGVVTSRDWLPVGPIRIGLTSGASTPDSQVGAVIRRLEALANPVPPSPG